jgi:hypothetical protein
MRYLHNVLILRYIDRLQSLVYGIIIFLFLKALKYRKHRETLTGDDYMKQSSEENIFVSTKEIPLRASQLVLVTSQL